MDDRIDLLFGRSPMPLDLPASITLLQGASIPKLEDPEAALEEAIARPIGTHSLTALLRENSPETVAITISDNTRPVPNRMIVRQLLKALHAEGVGPDQCTILVGTGMHRPSTEQEKVEMLGADLVRDYAVIDHVADDASSLVRICDDPPVSVCRHFVEADFRIVTGLIEPHFMAGFSGGRKGICPALVDLKTVQRFHGFETLSHPRAVSGQLHGNPCHDEALRIARLVGCDFLVNVAVDRNRRPAAFFVGHPERAHEAGCRQVAAWNTARVDAPFDLVITNGGGYPLDQTYYQTVKGMVAALPALHSDSTLLIVAACTEGVGSAAYEKILSRWGKDWRGFLGHISSTDVVEKDQWQLQMQARVSARIGPERMVVATDAFDAERLIQFGVTPCPGDGDAHERAQQFVKTYGAQHPDARIAAIPEGPYTMLVSA